MTISCFDFWKGGKTIEEGSEEWKEMSMKVREACESYGCFLLRCDEMNSNGAREELFKNMKTLFDLPQETKQKHTSPKPFKGFNSYNYLSTVYESFAIDDVLLSTSVNNLTNLMWPQGNPHFCETLKGTSLKMSDLSLVILKMIVEGYGLPQHHISDVENLKSSCNVRMNMYDTDKKNTVNRNIANDHIDKNTLTILSENEVPGLQVQSKTGEWVEVVIPKNCFVVIVGDALKAWSNARIHAAMHRVVTNEEKQRFTFGVFVAPREDMKIEVPHELVDEKIHPLRYRAFNYGEFLSFYASNFRNNNGNALEVFAGL